MCVTCGAQQGCAMALASTPRDQVQHQQHDGAVLYSAQRVQLCGANNAADQALLAVLHIAATCCV
jgi:hypothetical protein